MMNRISLRHFIIFGFIIFVSMPLFLAGSEVNLLTQICILSIFAISFNLVFGFSNLPSFGHAAFFGLAGYGFIYGLSYFPEAIVAPIVIGISITVIYSVIVGVVSLRGGGIYFAMLTFAFAQFAFELANRFTEFTGGAGGMILRANNLPFDRLLLNNTVIYILSLVCLVIIIVIGLRIVNSPFGKVLQAIRVNEERAKSIGYPTWRVKFVIFVISGFFASFAGILQALNSQFISPNSLHFEKSLEVILISIIGGSVSIPGAVIGSIFLVSLREMLSGFETPSSIILGIILIMFTFKLPDGIVGYVHKLYE